MNTYARQFVEQMPRPDVDLIDGLPPTVSIEQRNSRGGGKSTVATVTEIFHFVRLLYARLGTQYCPRCQVAVSAQTRDELGRRLREETKTRGDLLLLAPVVKNRKGFHTEIATWAAKHGYKEIRADGAMRDTETPLRLDRFKEHNIEVVVGVLEGGRSLAKASESLALIDKALELGHGTILTLDNHRLETVHSTERVCPQCGDSFEPLDPKMLSYNSPRGWCPRCRGFGELFYLPDVERGARAEAIEESWYSWQEGEREMCPECEGTRLNPLARAVRLRLAAPDGAGGRGKSDASPQKSAPSLVALSRLSVSDAAEFFQAARLGGRDAEIARDILPEIRERLKFLGEVGLGYLELGRGVPTLSSGEAQRIRLAAQLGSNLSGVLYVLDEPTIGLHARDNEQLLDALAALRARGNSLVVVEHDDATMRRADYIIDLGPGAGVQGGQVVAVGNLRELQACPESITGQFLRERKKFPARGERRPVNLAKAGRKSSEPTGCLVLRGAKKNNLKNLTVKFPLNRFVVITGVSGSGKSTLIRECLLPALKAALGKPSAKAKSGEADLASHGALSGVEAIREVHEVDQSPIGRTPRSVPATYVGFFDEIRKVFAQVPEARLRGYGPGRFSFNSAAGRCPSCEGAGVVKVEMSFLPPAYVRCEACGATRFNRETLDIEFHGKNIAQVLDLSVTEADEFFAPFSKIHRALKALCDTGLGYLKLGQTSPTLSGGEAQRIKLVSHLIGGLSGAGARETRPGQVAETRGALFLLEEPTIGLHGTDVRRLVEVIQRLVDAGHSVIVIEHNLDLIAEADWVLDLGPEGGAAGGWVVAEGTPEQLAEVPTSHTGKFLRETLRFKK